jgi:hypothetical protein
MIPSPKARGDDSDGYIAEKLKIAEWRNGNAILKTLSHATRDAPVDR